MDCHADAAPSHLHMSVCRFLLPVPGLFRLVPAPHLGNVLLPCRERRDGPGRPDRRPDSERRERPERRDIGRDSSRGERERRPLTSRGPRTEQPKA